MPSDRRLVDLGDQVGQAAGQDFGAAAAHLGQIGRHFLERAEAGAHVVRIDRVDARHVRVGRFAHAHDGAGAAFIAAFIDAGSAAAMRATSAISASRLRFSAAKSGAALDAALVHIEPAVDLDLQRVAAAVGPAVMAGGEAAGVGRVARRPHSPGPRRKVSTPLITAGAQEAPKQSPSTKSTRRLPGSRSIGPPTDGIEWQSISSGMAEARCAALDESFEPLMIGPVERFDAHARIGEVELAAVDLGAVGDDAGDGAEPGAHPRAGAVDDRRAARRRTWSGRAPTARGWGR